jgi:hypothetical protein
VSVATGDSYTDIMVRYEKGSDDESVATTIVAPVATSHPKLNEVQKEELRELRSAEAEYALLCKKAYMTALYKRFDTLGFA